MNKRCTISMDMLERILEDLGNMLNYADDGMLDRNDPEFADFFRRVDQAQETLDKLNEKYLKLVRK